MADAYTLGRAIRYPYDLTQKLHQTLVDATGRVVDAAVPAVQSFGRGLAGLPQADEPVSASTATAVNVANTSTRSKNPSMEGASLDGDVKPIASAPKSSDKTESVRVPVTNVVSPGVRAATTSYPSIQFNSPPPAVAAGAAGIDDVGFLPQQVNAQLSSLYEEARPLLSSAGIVDRLRGRQLMRARDRLLQGALGTVGARTAGINAQSNAMGARAGMLSAQTGAFRASNEVPLALLGAATQRYATDVGAETAAARDATLRDINLTNDATARRAQELNLLPRMQDVYQGEEYGRRLAAGDDEGAAEVALHGRAQPLPKNPPFQVSPMGTGVYTMQNGLPTFVSNDQLDPMLKKRRDALAASAPK